jgi:hypothetical protein
MRRFWPPLLWIGISIGSLLVLRGTSGGWRPGLAIAGIVLMVAVLAAGIYLAIKAWPDRPRHPGLYWAIGGMALWYLLLTGAAAIAGPEYAVAGVLAAVIPVAAISLLVSTIRQKTAVDDEGRLRDATADDEGDPFPGIGLDDATRTGYGASTRGAAMKRYSGSP